MRPSSHSGILTDGNDTGPGDVYAVARTTRRVQRAPKSLTCLLEPRRDYSMITPRPRSFSRSALSS
jgi:hypothetical protein